MWHLVSLECYTAEVDVTDNWENIIIQLQFYQDIRTLVIQAF